MTLLESELRSGVLRLTLNDPATRNSLSEAMMAALQGALDEAAADRAVRVVVIAATGPVFCSGHNLKEISARRADADKGASYFAQLFSDCAKLMTTIVRLPKPVIAEVQGLASAAGCQLVASCDLAYAAGTASFCTPGVNIGLFCSTPMVALSRNVTPKHAMEMLLTGDPISAQRAMEWGLVNRVVPAAELDAAVDELAAKLAAKPPATVAAGKRGFYQQMDMNLEQAYALAGKVISSDFAHPEGREGMNAFIEKRDPSWKK